MKIKLTTLRGTLNITDIRKFQKAALTIICLRSYSHEPQIMKKKNKLSINFGNQLENIDDEFTNKTTLHKL